MAAPKSTRSLSKNCPGNTDTAGKPPKEASHTPGVESTKLNVVRNIPTASALLRAATHAENGRAAMSPAMASTVIPMSDESA